MNVMIYGTKKCAETRKAERFFRERRIPAQFRDIGDKPLTEGELKGLAAGHRIDELIDVDSAAYARRGLAHMEFDPEEELLRDPLLLVTPIIRIDRKSFLRPVLSSLPL